MAEQWYVARGNKKVGPFTSAQMKALAERGQLLAQDMVHREGELKWMAADTVNGLFPHVVKPPVTLVQRLVAVRASVASWTQTTLVPRLKSGYRAHPRRFLLGVGGACAGLVLLWFVSCSRPHWMGFSDGPEGQAPGSKLRAMKRIVTECERHRSQEVLSRRDQEEIRETIERFHTIPFDVSANQQEAEAIVRLYEKHIEGKWRSSHFELLAEDIADMSSQLVLAHHSLR